MKGVYILYMLMLHSVLGKSQNSTSLFNYFNNDSIKYRVVRVQVPISSGNKKLVTACRILIDFDKAQIDSLKKIETKTYLNYLENNKSDFATNIILYYLYNRDATPLLILQNRMDLWPDVRVKEYNYWRDFLKG